jgi:hypothetical protein
MKCIIRKKIHNFNCKTTENIDAQNRTLGRYFQRFNIIKEFFELRDRFRSIIEALSAT